MVNSVADVTLSKSQSNGAMLKRWKKARLSLACVAVIGLLLAGFLFWPTTPVDLGVGNRLVTSGVLASWRNGDLIVLVRHEERCDRSSNPCFGPAEGLTINGTQQATNLGKAFNTLGMENTDVLASPATRTAQTAQFMFGKATLLSSPSAICGKAMGEELLPHKEPGRNLVVVTHSGCISDLQTELGYPHADAAEYGSALFVQVLPNGKLKAVGSMKTEEWAAALKQL
ncbi:histidine phosphatase family protein [Pseudomonas palleroniana]|uniref:Histidine phosphatase family protein n=1 Tax=Pseudomonas palleroniana TaxID=191390 RepID=A0A1H5NCD9_9PSED|nr:histidine phosphatase family protein [Pseudomonas palleroniana]KAB0570386.1 histidine phosphatase family protein [Pseudomonas palleroniana]PTC31417.1 histidine phosphatase family protein [Pseudomonas palleroniana]SEE99225.1 Histidine phosphatase superfamily (branch 1) [Pseudomonas palleroniana]